MRTFGKVFVGCCCWMGLKIPGSSKAWFYRRYDGGAGEPGSSSGPLSTLLPSSCNCMI